MKKELCEKLAEDFPNVFKNYKYMGVGDGWHDLIRELAEKLEPYAKAWWEERDPEEDTSLRRHLPSFVFQIKEKFGGLRVYTNGDGIIQVTEAVNVAERASFKVCEECGKPGIRRMGGWIKTRCDEHTPKDNGE